MVFPNDDPTSSEYLAQQATIPVQKTFFDGFQAAVLAQVGQMEFDTLDFEIFDLWVDPKTKEYVQMWRVWKYKGTTLRPILVHPIHSFNFTEGNIKIMLNKISARL